MAALLALTALGACQTLPQVVQTGQSTFAIRFDPQQTTPIQADALAIQHCGRATARLLSTETGFDGFGRRLYRCEAR